MNRYLLFLMAAGLAPAATLENDRVRVVFEETHGALTSFVDKTTGQEFLRPEGAGLYELNLDRVTVRDRDGKATVTVRGRSVVIASTHADPRLTVRVECSLGEAGLECGITVKNASPLALTSVRFPAVEFRARLGATGEDDRLLLPMCDGYVIENPDANLQGSRGTRYPGTASVQMLAFYSPRAGVRVTALDGSGYAKAIGVNRRGPGMSLQLIHYPEVASGKDFTLPYPVQLSVFHGDWESAATDYRKWAVKQRWARKRLDQRTAELPQWLQKMPFFYTMAIRGLNAENQQGLRYDLIAEQTEEYAKLLESPVTAMVMSWEKQGPWVTPDYFPTVGGDRPFRALMQRLHAGGNPSLIFFSGLKWTLRKGESLNETEAFQRDGEAAAIVGQDGKTLVVGKPTDDTGQYAELCPATKYAQDLISRLSRHVTELGVTAVQMDQIVGGGGPLCYSDKHGHPIGGGNWQINAVYRMFERLRSEGKARNKDFALSLEEPNEYFIPVLDTYHAREYAEARWPRDGKGIRGVPLFTFIYHDYLLGYGGDSAGISDHPSAQNIYSAAANLVNGKIAGAAVWSSYLSPAKVDPPLRELLKSALAMAHGPAHEFLLYGERMPTPKLGVPPVKIPIWVQSERKGENREFPAVVHSLWRLHNGKLGWVAVNVSSSVIQVKSPLDGDAVMLAPATAAFRRK